MAEPFKVVEDHVDHDILSIATFPGDHVCEHALGVGAAYDDALHCFTFAEFLLHDFCVAVLIVDDTAFGDEEVIDTDNRNVGFAGAGVGVPRPRPRTHHLHHDRYGQ